MALVLFGLMAMAGCDDGTVVPPQEDATPGASIDTNFSSTGSARFCELARSFHERSPAAAPGDIRGYGEALQESRMLASQLEDEASDEIAGDVRTLNATLAAVVTALEDADFQLPNVPTETLQELQGPDFQAAAVRLHAYTETTCPPEDR